MSVVGLIRGIWAAADSAGGQRATLTAACTLDQLSLSIASVANVPPGVIEIDLELMWLETYDKNSGVATVPPWGRGYQGTSKFAHVVNSEVVIHPRITRQRILELANQVITGLYPILYRPVETTVTIAELDSKVSVTCAAQPIAVTINDLEVARYRWGQGKLRFPNELAVGDIVAITSPSAPTQLTAQSYTVGEDFAYQTGLASSVAGLIEVGTLARIFAGVEGVRLQPDRTESSDRAQVVPATSSSSLAKLYQALFQQRLEVEIQAQNERNPLTLTWSR